MGTIREAWESYEAEVLPGDAGPAQRLETRRAFYAGAHVLLGYISEVGEDAVSEDAGVDYIESLHRECREFAGGVGRGN